MIQVHENRAAAEAAVAREIASLIRDGSGAVERPNGGIVLGLATGSTMVGVYRELVDVVRSDRLDVSKVTTFNLDEYTGLPLGDPRTFRSFMAAHLFEPLGFSESQVHFPDVRAGGDLASAREFEDRIAAAGGIDLQLLGLGRNGHIAFNEPGALHASRTRLIELDAVTRNDAAAAFGGLEHVPQGAVTMGVATILEARSLRVLAFGEAKAAIVERALHGPVGPEVPASYLRSHAELAVHLDRAAASAL